MTYALSITLVNETENMRFSEFTENLPTHLLTDDDTPDFGEIYREAQAEWGRCTGSVYVDVKDRPPKRVGWYFISRQHYEDDPGTYLRGAWVTVIERVPEQQRSVELPGVSRL